MTSDEGADLVGQIIEGLEPGSFVTKYVLVAEVIGQDGTRGVWTQTNAEAERWDTYGLLTHAMQGEHSAQVRDTMAGDE